MVNYQEMIGLNDDVTYEVDDVTYEVGVQVGCQRHVGCRRQDQESVRVVNESEGRARGEGLSTNNQREQLRRREVGNLVANNADKSCGVGLQYVRAQSGPITVRSVRSHSPAASAVCFLHIYIYIYIYIYIHVYLYIYIHV